MKKFTLILTAILLVSVMAINVFAVEFVPSIERKEGPALVETEDENGNIIVATVYNPDGTVYRHIYLGELIITPIMHVYEDEYDVPEAIEATLLAAYDELDVSNWRDLIIDFEEAWTEFTGGAPIENAIITDYFDVRFVNELDQILSEGRYLEFEIEVEHLSEDDIFLLVHKPTNTGVWHIEEYSIENHMLRMTVSVDSLSPFAIVADSGEGPAVDPDDPDSPQTSDVEYWAIAAVALVGIAGVVIIKKKTNKTEA